MYKLVAVTDLDKAYIYQLKKESIMSYVEKIWGWDEDYQVKDFEASFMPNHLKIILFDDKKVGFLELEERDTININELHLETHMQGLGIGSKIIKDICSSGKTVTLGCFKEITGAFNLYKRLGFILYLTTQTHICLKKVSKQD